jgi:hypothetical protein
MRPLFFLFLLLSFGILKAQTALYFDGTDDYVVVPGTSKLNGLQQITLETWLYTGNFSTSPCSNCSPIIWNQGQGYRFGTGNTKIVSFQLQNVSAAVTLNGSVTLNTNTWHHIAGTYDGTKMRIYVDGVATDSLTSSIAITYTSSSSDIWIADPATGWGGILEETRLWDYARSKKQIQEGMLKKYKSGTSGLVFSYGYEDGVAYKNNASVSSIADATSNKNHGTPSNFALQDTVSNFVLGRTYCDTTIYSKFNVSQCIKYTLPSQKRTVTASGTYSDTIISKKGCDSVMTIQVTILNPNSALVNIASCDSFRNPITGAVYKKSGKFNTTIKNKAGCDSVITFSVTIYKKDSTIYNYTECESVLLKNGKTVNLSGRYVDSLKGKRGCDSLVIHYVKIKKRSFAKRDLKVCQFVFCPSNPTKVFYKPGTYFDTIPNAIGCDSIIEYNVISGNTYSSLTVNTCVPYKSPSGKYTFTKTGNYNDTFFLGNKIGCDSIIHIDLTMDVALKQSLKITECKAYVVPSGKKVITSTQIVTDVIKSKKGCDSIEYTIDVTINQPNIGMSKNGNTLTANSTNVTAQFQWLDCGANYIKISGATAKQYTPKQNGQYAVEVKEDNCTDTSTCFSFVLTGIKPILHNEQSITPNPSNGQFTLESSVTLHHVKIHLYDSEGSIKQIWEMDELSEEPFNVAISSGLYYLKIEASEGLKVIPLMIK